MQTPTLPTTFANQPTWAASDDFVFDGIHLELGDQPILRDISLAFKRRETVAIIGESGCGKTTLLKIMIGLLAPTQGTAWFRGKSLAGMTPREQMGLRRNFGFLFQAAALFDSMSVFDNIAFGLRTQGVLSEKEIQPIVEKQLEEVGLSASVGEKFPSELSGGMRKRVGLARALALNPEFMLFDEPTTGLDPVMTDVINELILKVRRNLGITGILVTHEMRTVRKVADRVIMLAPLASLEPDESQILFDGSVAELDLCPDRRIRSFIQGDSQGAGAKALGRKPVQESPRLPQLVSPQPVNSLPERPMAGLRWIDPEALQEPPAAEPAHFIPLFDRQKAESIKVATPPLESFANPISTLLATSPVVLDSILAFPASAGSHPSMHSIEATTDAFHHPPTMDQAEDGGAEETSSQNEAGEDEASEEGESDDEEEDPEPGPAQEMSPTAAFAIGTLGVAAASGLAAAAEPAFAISPAVPQWFLDQENPNERHRFLPAFAPASGEVHLEGPAHPAEAAAVAETQPEPLLDLPSQPETSTLGSFASDLLEDQTSLPLELEAEGPTEQELATQQSEEDAAPPIEPPLNLFDSGASHKEVHEPDPSPLGEIVSDLLEDQTGLPLEPEAQEPAEEESAIQQSEENAGQAIEPLLNLSDNSTAHEPDTSPLSEIASHPLEDHAELPLESEAQEPQEVNLDAATDEPPELLEEQAATQSIEPDAALEGRDEPFESESNFFHEQAVEAIPATLASLDTPLEPMPSVETELASANPQTQSEEPATEPVMAAQQELPPIQEESTEPGADTEASIASPELDQVLETESPPPIGEESLPRTEAEEEPDGESQRIDRLFASEDSPPSQDPFEQPAGELGIAEPLVHTAAAAFASGAAMPGALPVAAMSVEAQASPEESISPVLHPPQEAQLPPDLEAAVEQHREDAELVPSPVTASEITEAAELQPHHRAVEGTHAETSSRAEAVESIAPEFEEVPPSPPISVEEEISPVASQRAEELPEAPEAAIVNESPAFEAEQELPPVETEATSPRPLPIEHESVPVPSTPEDQISRQTEEVDRAEPIEDLNAVSDAALPVAPPVVFEPVSTQTAAVEAPQEPEIEPERVPEPKFEVPPLEPVPQEVAREEPEPIFTQLKSEPVEPETVPAEEPSREEAPEQPALPEVNEASVPWPMREEPADSRAAPRETVSPSIWDQPAMTDEPSPGETREAATHGGSGSTTRFEAPLPAWESLVGRDFEAPLGVSESSATEEVSPPGQAGHRDPHILPILQNEISPGLGSPPQPLSEASDSAPERTEKENQS